MRDLMVAVLVSGISFCAIANTVFGEIVSQSFTPGQWLSCGIHCQYQELEFDLGYGLASVDSVWVDLSGVSNTGECCVTQGPSDFCFDCWDGVLVELSGDAPFGHCDQWAVNPDGIFDCIGGICQPTGDRQRFYTTVYMSAIELWQGDSYSYQTIESRPTLGDIFLDGAVTIRLERLHGGLYGYRCSAGLPDLEEVVVYVSYDSAVQGYSEGWGALKATYR